jgi:hypothetical protein
MVAVYGDVQAKDDYTHPLGPEQHFNESMYFNFFDHKRGAGGFARIGNRANEGYAEVTVCLYLPTGEVLFNYMRPQIEGNEAMDAGGMRFEVVEPLAKHRTTYQGGAVYLTDPAQMTDPGQAFRENPYKKVTLDISHEAVGPVYGSSGRNARPEADPEKEFGRAHYEQHMRTSGSITVDGERTEIDGTGLRDHSWGPRYWQAIHSYRWLTCTFGPDLGIMVSEIMREKNGERAQNGVVVRGEGLERITSVGIDTEFAPESMFHKRMKAHLGLANGERLELDGRVKSFIPLRNRRAGMVTHIGEGMTEYRLGDRVAFGISEYLDQVE